MHQQFNLYVFFQEKIKTHVHKMPCTRKLIASLLIIVQASITRVLDKKVVMWYMLKIKRSKLLHYQQHKDLKRIRLNE